MLFVKSEWKVEMKLYYLFAIGLVLTVIVGCAPPTPTPSLTPSQELEFTEQLASYPPELIEAYLAISKFSADCIIQPREKITLDYAKTLFEGEKLKQVLGTREQWWRNAVVTDGEWQPGAVKAILETLYFYEPKQPTTQELAKIQEMLHNFSAAEFEQYERNKDKYADENRLWKEKEKEFVELAKQVSPYWRSKEIPAQTFDSYSIKLIRDGEIIKHLAHLAWLEGNGLVPWSIGDYSQDELASLLDYEEIEKWLPLPRSLEDMWDREPRSMEKEEWLAVAQSLAEEREKLGYWGWVEKCKTLPKEELEVAEWVSHQLSVPSFEWISAYPFATELTRGSKTRLEAIEKIVDWARMNMMHWRIEELAKEQERLYGQHSFKPSDPPVWAVLIRKQGGCGLACKLIIYLCRSLNIPAKLMMTVRPVGSRAEWDIIEPRCLKPGETAHNVLYLPTEDIWIHGDSVYWPEFKDKRVEELFWTKEEIKRTFAPGD